MASTGGKEPTVQQWSEISLTPVWILTGSSEGSGRNSASSPKIKSGGNSGKRALNMMSPAKQRQLTISTIMP